MEKSLKERREELEREMKELEALEKSASIRKEESEKVERIERLLLDLKDQPLKCSLPLQSVAHVKKVYDSRSNDCQGCYFNTTCQEILSLTGKSKGNKVKGTGTGKKAEVEIKKEFPKFGLAIYTIDGKRFECHYTNWENYKATINTRTGGHRKAMEAVGATPQQVSGLIHFNGMHKQLGL